MDKFFCPHCGKEIWWDYSESWPDYEAPVEKQWFLQCSDCDYIQYDK